MGDSASSTRDILELRSLKPQTTLALDNRMKKLHLERSRTLLKRFSCGCHAAVLFMDETVFTNERCFIRQNDRIPALTINEAISKGRLVTRMGHKA